MTAEKYIEALLELNMIDITENSIIVSKFDKCRHKHFDIIVEIFSSNTDNRKSRDSVKIIFNNEIFFTARKIDYKNKHILEDVISKLISLIRKLKIENIIDEK